MVHWLSTDTVTSSPVPQSALVTAIAFISLYRKGGSVLTDTYTVSLLTHPSLSFVERTGSPALTLTA